MVKNKLLDSSTYRPNEIYVRATDINRTIESAMAQLLGIYPLGKSLQNNQTSKAVPTLNVDASVLQDANNALKTASLPNNYMPVPVHVHHWVYDRFQPTDSCPVVGNERSRRQKSPEIEQQLYSVHNQTVKDMATLMGKDPNNFTSFQAVDYADDLWARYFDQVYPMAPFDKTFLDRMMLLN